MNRLGFFEEDSRWVEIVGEEDLLEKLEERTSNIKETIEEVDESLKSIGNTK